ncbi:MarR family winged helix-turn-helix transcriptional regulator [Plantibacter sp. YIM 135249]|uniref:MarR family winged helix-turn-helix transcriptional regulator n=1 Tax=Plantibacter sp. YIM 135249 TaxID=3423918 RepID=UPI003D342496
MSDDRQDPPSEHSADATADASAPAAESADGTADAVGLIEQALVRIRRDQSRRRLHRRGGPGFAGGPGFPGGPDFRGGFPGGFDGRRGGPWGDPHHGRDHQPEHGRAEGDADGHDRDHDRTRDRTRGNGRDDERGTGRRTPHDRSLGQAARFRMLEAIDGAGEGAGGGASAGMGISALAAAIGVDQPRASRLVAEATERGHVRRAVDPQDGRRSVVQLTDAGRAILHEAHRGRRDAVTTALSGFTAAETEQFATLLSRFVDAWPRDDE